MVKKNRFLPPFNGIITASIEKYRKNRERDNKMKQGFDNEKYLHLQSEKIRERIGCFDNKLYLEFGGKLFDDYHASRVLPGFAPSSKLQMLLELADQAELVIAINADDIEKNKMRGDLGITYDDEVLRLIELYREKGLYVGSVVLTQYQGQTGTAAFRTKLEKRGIPVYCHYRIDGYPKNIPLIVSEEGYGKNDYIVTSRPLVVVTAPGPGSGKMATCLSQLYHEHKRGIRAGYAKFETFPIWNLPLDHPVNMAYEAATADLNDVNMIDSFHLSAYGVSTVNYNRDIEIFPVLNAMFQRIFGSSPYKSPTDMGVNMAGYCITDDEVCREASRQEIIRRYYETIIKHTDQEATEEEVFKIQFLMNTLGISGEDRRAVADARKRAAASGDDCAAIELTDGRLITGQTSELLGSCSAVLLNTLKVIAGIDHDHLLISREALEPIQRLKTQYLGSKNPRLHTDETLIALSISASGNEDARRALDALSSLQGCQLHCTSRLSKVDLSTLRKLGLQVTMEPAAAQK